MNFELNPCNSCMKHLSKKSDGINVNDVNNCCYKILGAFKGIDDVNAIRNLPEAKNCQMCVNNAINMVGKKNCSLDPKNCSLRVEPPALYNSSSHYFPDLLRQENDINKAKNMCLEKCKGDYLKNECMENCILDANAVSSNTIESYVPKKNVADENSEEEKIETTYSKYIKDNPVLFYTTYGLFSLIFILIIISFLKIFLSATRPL